MKQYDSHWKREDDLCLVRAVFKGFTGEGIAYETGLTIGQINSRLQSLGLGIAEGRRAKRNGVTPEQYLDASPQYKRDLPLLSHEEPLFAMLAAIAIQLATIADTLGSLSNRLKDAA